MLKRSHGASVSDSVGCRAEFETLEARVVLDATPTNPAYPVVELNTNLGSVFIELYPDTAPHGVQNFLGYVERRDYDNSIFHRLDHGFVLQGGGFRWDTEEFWFADVPKQDPIVNEFSRSNVQWTVAYAKLSGDPDSATNQFFFNLGNNASNLDTQNGGFTVFGGVVGGKEVVTTLSQLKVARFSNSGAFTTVPLLVDPDSITFNDLLPEHFATILSARLVYEPPASLLVGDNVLPGGSADSFDRATIGILNQFGGATVFRQNADGTGWSVTDLGLKTQNTGQTGELVSWVDPKDSRTYAAAPSAEGIRLYTNSGEGVWSARNLNGEIAGSGLIVSSLTSFITRDGLVMLAGQSATGDLLLFSQTGGIDGQGNLAWSFRNVSASDLAPQGLATPAFVSDLVSYVTSWNGLNIAGLDASGAIHAVWWAPGLERWTVSNLSAITGAPALFGGLTPYLTSWGGINLAGINAQGDVTTTWWVPEFEGEWVQSNLSQLFDGPGLEPGSLASYVTPWGGLNVVGRRSDGHTVVYWWAPGIADDRWAVTAISDFIDGAPLFSGRVAGIASPAGTISLVGASADNELLRYWWQPGGEWQAENVSQKAVLV
ncbi:MAG: peptidylprolyl isomerase [Phycisphaeraceae bacterium]|nr:peptidylprolyl isomerase [Phycisphaeraceae bacterium]